MLPIMNPDTVNFTRRPLWRRWSWIGAAIVLLTLLMSTQVKAEYPSPPHKGLPLSTFWISPDGQRVVFMTDQNVNGSYELYSAPTDGNSPAVPLGRLLPSSLAPEYYFIISLAFSPDSSQLVFLARQEADSTYELPWVYELYSVPVAGGDMVKLNHTQERYAGVSAFQISPDSRRVIYQARQQENGQDELYSELLSGGEVIKLNAPLSGRGNINKFEISPDGSRVVYRVDGVDEPDELYNTLLTGGTAPVKISGATTHNSQIVNFHISPNSSRVVYQADQDTSERDELYSTPIAGGTVPVKLNSLLVDEAEVKDPRSTDGILRDTFQISPDSSRVIYQVDQGFDKAKELYSVPLGGGIAVKLNSPLNGNIFSFQISPDSRRVIYGESDQEYEPAEYDLFSASLDGGEVVRLDGPLVSANSYQISADSSRVVYLAKTVKEGMLELYTAPLIGGKVVKLNGPLASGSSIGTFQINPDSSGVVYKVHGEPYQETMYTIPFGIGTTPVKLNRVILPEGYSGQFQLSPDSSRVVYWATLNFPDVPQLYSLSLTDTTEPVNLSGPLFRYGDVVEFQITPDSRQVVYLVERGWLAYALYSVPLSGGKAVKLGEVSHKRDGGTFQISPDSRRVVYPTQQTGRNNQQGLYSVPIGGGTTPVKLNGPLVKDGVVAEFRISTDSSRVVYRADQETEGVHELYSVPLGGGEVVKLNEPPDGGFGVFEFKISSDSRRVVYRSDQDADNVYELYSVPLAGGAAPIQLNEKLDQEDFKNYISTFALSPDSSRVVYQVRRQGTNQAVENLLYSVPFSGGNPIQLNDRPLDSGVTNIFHIGFDSSRVVYLAADGELYSVSLAGSSASVRLIDPLDRNNSISYFEMSPDGNRVIFRMTTGGELYSVSSKGGAAPVKLNGPLAKDDRIDRFYISRDSRWMIYWIVHETAGMQELYRVPLGGGEVVKLNTGPISKHSAIWTSQISPTSSRVVYLCCAVNRAALHVELYSIPIADNTTPIKLNEPLLSGSYVSSFLISPDGSSVVYLAQQDIPGVDELYHVPLAGGAAPVKLNGLLALGDQ